VSEPRWILIALFAVLLLSSARLCWQQWRGSARGRGVFASLLVLQAVATVLLYLTLVPPMQRVAGGQLTVLTGAADQVRWSAAPGEAVVALPEATKVADALAAPDLATVLRQHPGPTSLRLIGDGLSARDRDAALPRGVRIEWPSAPQGWIALQPPPVAAPGAVFTVSARAQGVPSARAELVDPAGLVVDRAMPGADGRVQLDGVARVPGQSTFRLRLLDAGQHVVDTLEVPVDTVGAAAPRLLILAGAPGPELKYLRRWATDAGLAVQAHAHAGGGVSLGDAPVALTAATLAATDAVLLDERSLGTLSVPSAARCSGPPVAGWAFSSAPVARLATAPARRCAAGACPSPAATRPRPCHCRPMPMPRCCRRVVARNDLQRTPPPTSTKPTWPRTRLRCRCWSDWV